MACEWLFRKPSPAVFAKRGLWRFAADAVNDVDANDADARPKQPIDQPEPGLTSNDDDARSHDDVHVHARWSFFSARSSGLLVCTLAVQ